VLTWRIRIGLLSMKPSLSGGSNFVSVPIPHQHGLTIVPKRFA